MKLDQVKVRLTYALTRGDLEMFEGRCDEARANMLWAFQFAQEIGDEYILNNLGRGLANLEFAAGNIERAAELCEATIDRAKSIEGGDFLGFAYCDYACLCLLRNDIERARDFARRALTPTIAGAGEEASHCAIDHLAVVAALSERPQIAARLSGFFQAWSGGYCESYLHRSSQICYTIRWMRTCRQTRSRSCAPREAR
jgi:ATP/maltotriose-dependent transcriptional regulator MalT